jgi:hypothetical protein
MNPYAIIIGILVFLGALVGAERFGEHRGIALQAQTDQTRFDKISRDLDAQKAQANKLMADAAARDAAAAAAAAQLHQQQEIAHENDQARTDAAHQRAIDAGRLRFAGTREDAGGGRSGGSAVPAPADAAGPAGAATVELSDEASGALRELTFECDRLADNYRAAYRFLYPSWRDPLTDPPPTAPAAAEPVTATP